MRMRKPFIIALKVVAVGIILIGNVRAQDTPPGSTQQSPAANTAQTPATKTQKAPADKSGTAPATKSQTPVARKQSPTAKSQAPLTLTTQKDKTSYAIGMNFGESLHKQSVEVDPNILMRGMKDALAGGKTLLTEEEARALIAELQGELRKKMEEKMAKEGEAFLAANKTKEGVVTLPSGLQYKILKAGTGEKPTTSDSVVCNYRGTLINGKEFDSSYKRGQPATFPVSGVIKGWTEALQLMPVGSKWELFVPADLAYGARGAGGDIGPNSTLIFEVELISIPPKSK
ncbi:MAG: FKBP-type peptidyl-prolyl cis-trans isomerase [Candidatus Acidiferrales bacterium]